jgi:hypothetical protein
VGPGFTWYEVLGVLPAAAAGEIWRGYDSKAALLRPEVLAGAPSPVLIAASRARDAVDAAWRVLGDPARRAAYDDAIGIRRAGEGLAGPRNDPSQPGWDQSDLGFVPGALGAELLGGLLALSDVVTAHPGPPNRVTVPDVRGLFYSVAFGIVGRLGLRVVVVRLTEHPQPVHGLVVGQSPEPLTRARRASELTLQVWHPPRARS